MRFDTQNVRVLYRNRESAHVPWGRPNASESLRNPPEPPGTPPEPPGKPLRNPRGTPLKADASVVTCDVFFVRRYAGHDSSGHGCVATCASRSRKTFLAKKIEVPRSRLNSCSLRKSIRSWPFTPVCVPMQNLGSQRWRLRALLDGLHCDDAHCGVAVWVH